MFLYINEIVSENYTRQRLLPLADIKEVFEKKKLYQEDLVCVIKLEGQLLEIKESFEAIRCQLKNIGACGY